jgi:hypothetical protein
MKSIKKFIILCVYNKNLINEKENQNKNVKDEQLLKEKENKDEDQIYFSNHEHHTPITKTIKIDEKTKLSDNIHLEINDLQSVSFKEKNKSMKDFKDDYTSNPSNKFREGNVELMRKKIKHLRLIFMGTKIILS